MLSSRTVSRFPFGIVDPEKMRELIEQAKWRTEPPPTPKSIAEYLSVDEERQKEIIERILHSIGSDGKYKPKLFQK